MSSGVAKRILEKRGWPPGVESERPVGAEGAGVGGGGGAAAAIFGGN